MKSRGLSRLVSVVFALGLAAMIVSRAHAQANTNVWIDTLALDGTSLTIAGRNFGGGPVVLVNGGAVVVSHSNDTEIVAVIPQLGRGMHIVKVVRDSSQGGSAVSTLQIR
jgi:hypothetical protein